MNQFGEFLGDIRRSNTGFSTPLLEHLEACAWSGELDGIPPISIDKLEHVLCHLKVRKAQDANGFVAAMLKFGGVDLSKCLLRSFESFTPCCAPEILNPRGRNTVFFMLPKARGDHATEQLETHRCIENNI